MGSGSELTLTQEILDAVPGGVVHVRADGAVLSANGEALQILGLSYDDVTHRYTNDWDPVTVREDGSPCPVEDYPVTRALRTGQRQQNQTIGIQRPDGQISWAVFTALPLTDAGGNIAGAVVTFVDVTDYKRVELERAAEREQLVRARQLEALGRLSGGVAHDFNNLLTVIQGGIDLLRNRLEGTSHAASLETIGDAAMRAGRLTRQLLAFGRQENLDPCVVDVDRLLDGMEEMVHRLVREDVVFTFEPGANGATVKADPVALERVVLNLVTNARDAMIEGGVFKISTSVEIRHARTVDLPPGRYVVIAVEDSGTGIDEETQTHMFEPFLTTKAFNGTGLGLSSAHGIVRQSGGDIEVESTVGRGTTIRLVLPVSTEAVAERTRSSGIISNPPAEGTILLVEDNDAVRRVTARLLAHAGYTVLQAPASWEVMDAYRDRLGEIDLVITDIVMPRLSGARLAEQLLEIEPDLKVLFVSGHTKREVTVRGISTDDLNFLPKPFTADLILSRVHELLHPTSSS